MEYFANSFFFWNNKIESIMSWSLFYIPYNLLMVNVKEKQDVCKFTEV